MFKFLLISCKQNALHPNTYKHIEALFTSNKASHKVNPSYCHMSHKYANSNLSICQNSSIHWKLNIFSVKIHDFFDLSPNNICIPFSESPVYIVADAHPQLCLRNPRANRIVLYGYFFKSTQAFFKHSSAGKSK